MNDRFGHLFGDEVLLLVARIMRSVFRPHDVLFRFGGEEFVVLLAATNATVAQVAVERLRATVEAYAFPQVGQVTISAGFTCVSPDDSPIGAFERGDEALYLAKQQGRNRALCWEELVATGELTASRTGERDRVVLRPGGSGGVNTPGHRRHKNRP